MLIRVYNGRKPDNTVKTHLEQGLKRLIKLKLKSEN